MTEKTIPNWITIVASLIAYCVMNVQDAAIGLSRGEPSLIAGAAIACILSGSMVYVLSRASRVVHADHNNH